MPDHHDRIASRSPGGTRSRWAAIGAAVAVTLGAGSIGLVSASSSSSGGAFTAVVPCRAADTRVGIGPHATPVGAGETVTFGIAGNQGQCDSVPADATAVALNVTIASPTADSYLTVWPADAPQPNASNLNWKAGQGPTPNAVTTKLSAAGAVAVFNESGDVDVILDVTGFYSKGSTDHGVPGPQGPAGPQGAPGPPGAPGATGATGARGVSAWNTIPAGTTVTGVQRWQTATSSSVGEPFQFSIPLPARAPQPLADADVRMANEAGSGCIGTGAAPTAPPGVVCIHVVSVQNANTFRGAEVAQLRDHAFQVRWQTATTGTTTIVEVTWAYTAP